MPAPWSPDSTKDALLENLATALPPGDDVHSGTAYALVRGQPSFDNIDDYDNLAYVRCNWPRFYPAGAPPELPGAAAPTVTAINPTSAKASKDFQLSIEGNGFEAGALVLVGASTATPSELSESFISVTVTAAMIPSPGSVLISVQNPDSQVSNQLTLTLT
jgi:hypothetical protein